MALEPISGDSKIVVHNSNSRLGSAKPNKDHQGASITEVVQAALPKIYRASLTAGDAAGGIEIHENTLGADLSWSSSATGEITSAPNAVIPTVPAKVFVNATAKYTGNGTIPVTGINYTGTSEVGGSIAIFSQSGGSPANTTLFVEIAVYS